MSEVKTNVINLFGKREPDLTPMQQIEKRLDKIDSLLDSLKDIEQKNLTNKERMERERLAHNKNLTKRLNLTKDK
jgi:hypothetical protein